MRAGDPEDPGTHVGSLISQAPMGKVLGAMRRGQQKGAEVLTGGHRVTEGALARGAFVTPTVSDDCRDGMALVREEVFGPVMAVLAFDGEDEVVARADAAEFGRAARPDGPPSGTARNSKASMSLTSMSP